MSEAGFAFLCGESKMSLGYGFGGLGDRHNTKYPGTRLLASPCTRLRCLGFFFERWRYGRVRRESILLT